MYAIAQFHLVNLFSLRAITTNAFTARTLPCPTPAAVKLALLARLIERDAPDHSQHEIASAAQANLDWLAPLRVAWGTPPLITISAATMRIWKGDAADEPLTSTVGMREYAHFSGKFGLVLGPVVDKHRADLEYAVARLRALGVAESLVQLIAPPIWRDDVPAGFIWLTDETELTVLRGATEATVLDDLGAAPRFARLSVYRSHERETLPRLGEDRRRRVVMLPLRQRRATLSGRILERVVGAEWETGISHGGD